jgi:hypothetical protein
VLRSTDPAIREAAGKAFDDAAEEYQLYDSGTVLATLCDRPPC